MIKLVKLVEGFAMFLLFYLLFIRKKGGLKWISLIKPIFNYCFINQKINKSLIAMQWNMWNTTQFYANSNRICVFREVPNLIIRTVGYRSFAIPSGFINSARSSNRSRCIRGFSTTASPNPEGTNNGFILSMEETVRIKYNNLPASSIIKHKDSVVATRIIMSYTEVINIYYQLGLCRNKGIKYYFFFTRKFQCSRNILFPK